MSNSPRGEASVYPKLQPELSGWNVHDVSAGSNCIVASVEKPQPQHLMQQELKTKTEKESGQFCIAWGVPPGGNFLQSTVP